MTFQGLYDFLFQNFGIWVIGGVVVWKIAKSAVSGDTGSAVWACVIGAVAYWIGKDPIAFLDMCLTIFNKVKGGGA